MSVTGRPGLYKIITQGSNMLVVEDLSNGKRFPVHSRERIVSLGDIAMYTESADKPLGEILDLVYASEKGEAIDVKALAKDGKLRDKFAEILPDFDRDRVYDNDIKKLFTWYNILTKAGYTSFGEKSPENAEESTKENEEK